MARKQPQIRLRTWGIYTKWNSTAKELPKLSEVTERVPAVVDVEFGFVVNIRGARNQQLTYCIEHPGIRDSHGNTRPPFDGVVYIKTNDWNFYLGDTIWEPIDDKIGEWRMWVSLQKQVVAEKTFTVY